MQKHKNAHPPPPVSRNDICPGSDGKPEDLLLQHRLQDGRLLVLEGGYVLLHLQCEGGGQVTGEGGGCWLPHGGWPIYLGGGVNREMAAPAPHIAWKSLPWFYICLTLNGGSPAPPLNQRSILKISKFWRQTPGGGEAGETLHLMGVKRKEFSSENFGWIRMLLQQIHPHQKNGFPALGVGNPIQPFQARTAIQVAYVGRCLERSTSSDNPKQLR